MTARGVGIIALLALLGLILAWHLWWLPPARVPAWFALMLHALPLLPALALLWRRDPRAIVVGALGALILFGHGVMEAWVGPPARCAGLLEVALTLALIGAACWKGLQRRFKRNGTV